MTFCHESLRAAQSTSSRAGPRGGCAPPVQTACSRRDRSRPLTATRTRRPLATSLRTAYELSAAGPAPAATAAITAAVLESSRSEEHTSELQSLMRSSYAVFCLKKKKIISTQTEKNRYDTT